MSNKIWQQDSYWESYFANEFLRKKETEELVKSSEKNIEEDISEILEKYKWIFTIVNHDNEPKFILTMDDLEYGINKLKIIITNYIKKNFQKS